VRVPKIIPRIEAKPYEGLFKRATNNGVRQKKTKIGSPCLNNSFGCANAKRIADTRVRRIREKVLVFPVLLFPLFIESMSIFIIR